MERIALRRHEARMRAVDIAAVGEPTDERCKDAGARTHHAHAFAPGADLRFDERLHTRRQRSAERAHRVEAIDLHAERDQIGRRIRCIDVRAQLEGHGQEAIGRLRHATEREGLRVGIAGDRDELDFGVGRSGHRDQRDIHQLLRAGCDVALHDECIVRAGDSVDIEREATIAGEIADERQRVVGVAVDEAEVPSLRRMFDAPSSNEASPSTCIMPALVKRFAPAPKSDSPTTRHAPPAALLNASSSAPVRIAPTSTPPLEITACASSATEIAIRSPSPNAAMVPVLCTIASPVADRNAPVAEASAPYAVATMTPLLSSVAEPSTARVRLPIASASSASTHAEMRPVFEVDTVSRPITTVP